MNGEYGPGAYRSVTAPNVYLCTDDGRTLLSAGSYGLEYGHPAELESIDVATGTVTRGPSITAMATGGSLAAVATAEKPETVTLLAVPALTPVREIETAGPVTLLAVRGDTIAAAGAEPPTLTVVTEAGEHRVALPAKPSCLAVSEDGRVIAIGTDKGRSGNVITVDAGTGTIRHTLTGPRAPVTSVAVSAAADLVSAAAGPRVFGWTLSQKKPKAVSLWSATSGTDVVGITGGGRVIATASHEEIASLDPSSAAVEWSTKLYGPALLTGDRLISTRFHDLREHDPATGEIRHTWETLAYPDDLVGSSGTVVVAAGFARPLLLRRGETTATRVGSGHAREIVSVSFDGDRFATLGADQRICVWTRGAEEPSHTIDAEGSASHGGLLLSGTTLYAGLDWYLHRWALGDPEPQASTPHLKDDVALLLPLPEEDLLLVGCENTGRSYGMFYKVDPRTLEIRMENRSTLVGGVARHEWASPTFEMLHGLTRRTIDLATLETVTEETLTARDYSREFHVTAGRDLLVATRTAGDSSRLFITDVAANEHLVEEQDIPPMTGTAAMSDQDRFATPHADAIRLWNVRTGELERELPVPAGASALWWFPGGDALLATFRNGACYDIAL